MHPKREDGRYENYAGVIFERKEDYLAWIEKVSKDWEDCEVCKNEHTGPKIFYIFSEDI